jgi:uncharacterized protein (DUF1800 family)
MEVSRRRFIQLGGVAAAGVAAPGWLAAQAIAKPVAAWTASAASDMPEPDIEALLCCRAMFGPRPGDVAQVKAVGAAQWIESQLDFEAIDDSEMEDRLAQELTTLAMVPRELLSYADEDYRYTPRDELRLASLYRKVFSPRQLYEVMVEFWADHFAIYHNQNLCEFFLTADNRDVIRRHALGTFKDLLTASAQSPAMSNFLNNDVSTKRRPNENYAREIMELHTLGVAVDDYPYTERDVKQVALCFTGWTWERRQGNPALGEFVYNDDAHWQGSKEVLGETIPAAGGIQDGYRVIDILTQHEATPKFLALKMVRRFVTDDPLGQTPDLVNRVADAYTRTQGDIKEMVRTILFSSEFADSFATYGGRMSRPFDLIARELRSIDVTPEQFTLGTRGSGSAPYRNSMNTLAALGQVPFNWPDPDGYPDVKDRWTGASPLLTRWNTGLAMAAAGVGSAQFIPGLRPADQTPGALTTAGEVVDYWIDRLLSRPMLEEDRQTVIDYLTDGGDESTPINTVVRNRIPVLIALILDSPYYQWR